MSNVVFASELWFPNFSTFDGTNNIPLTIEGISETIKWFTHGNPTKYHKQLQQVLAKDAGVAHQLVSDLKRQKYKNIENNSEVCVQFKFKNSLLFHKICKSMDVIYELK